MKLFLPFAKPTIDEASIAAVAGVLRSGQLASGPKVKEFEASLGTYLKGGSAALVGASSSPLTGTTDMGAEGAAGRHVRVMTSATAGLEMALEVAGIRGGDEVILPAMSFAASANVIARLKAKPVFVDVDLHTRNLNADAVRQALTRKTRAIMPVHFSGLAVDMDGIADIAREHSLRVIEDAAHAIGTSYKGARIGSFGDLVVFSFHPNKNMTTIEGGAISTANPAEAAKLEQYRFHGIEKDADGGIDVQFPGAKSNMPDVSAQLGIDQLKRLDGFNQRRRQLASLYFEQLADFEGVVLPARGDEGHSWHMFTVLLDFEAQGFSRVTFQKTMAERGIGVGIHYPCIPAMSYYRVLGYRAEDYPVASRIGRQTVTLPLFPTMRDEDVGRVCTELKRLVAAKPAVRTRKRSARG